MIRIITGAVMVLALLIIGDARNRKQVDPGNLDDTGKPKLSDGTIIHGNTFFIYNKKWRHAKLAQWGGSDTSICTWEGKPKPDQLWVFRRDEIKKDYFFIENAKYEDSRLFFYGHKPKYYSHYYLYQDVRVTRGHHDDNQLWKLVPQRGRRGDYFKIINYTDDSLKLRKKGRGDDDLTTIGVAKDKDEELWTLKPRFKVRSECHCIRGVDNRGKNKTDPGKKIYKSGLKVTKSRELTTKTSLGTTLSSSIPQIFGATLTASINKEIANVDFSARETTWTETDEKQLNAPPNMNYKEFQHRIHFESDLKKDNLVLLSQNFYPKYSETDEFPVLDNYCNEMNSTVLGTLIFCS